MSENMERGGIWAPLPVMRRGMRHYACQIQTIIEQAYMFILNTFFSIQFGISFDLIENLLNVIWYLLL